MRLKPLFARQRVVGFPRRVLCEKLHAGATPLLHKSRRPIVATVEGAPDGVLKHMHSLHYMRERRIVSRIWYPFATRS